MERLFGTDGIRGRANEYPMTPEIALRVGKAVGYIFRKNKNYRGKIIIGKDTRISGYMFEAALVSGICSMGADAYLLGPMPTPGIGFITKNMRADAGIVISASHNPYYDNGIKIFKSDGYKLSDELEREIEELVLSDNDIKASDVGKAHRIEDAVGRYVVYLKQTFPEHETLDGLKIVIDCANGATYKVAPVVFSELGAELIVINDKPDGKNINYKCGSTSPEGMCQVVKEKGADIGVAFDGDGDRAIFCDEKGNIVDGDDVLAICASELKYDGRLDPPVVVSTIVANMGLEIALRENGIKLVRTKVGDRFVYEKMKELGAVLGGEPSGHTIFMKYGLTGDGILTALQLLWVLKKNSKSLSELVRERSKKFPKKEINVNVAEKIPLENTPVWQDIERARKLVSECNGRIVVRYSGTEKKLRILAEGEDEIIIDKAACLVAEAAKKFLGGF